MLTIDRTDAVQGKGRAMQINPVIEGVAGANGVLSGLAPTDGGSDTVAVAAGKAIANNTYASYAGGSVSLAARHATLPRYSIITISSAGAVAETAGTAAAVPTPPACPTDKAVLALVKVPQTGGGSISVSDNRVFIMQQRRNQVTQVTSSTGTVNGSGWYLGATAFVSYSEYLSVSAPYCTSTVTVTIDGGSALTDTHTVTTRAPSAVGADYPISSFASVPGPLRFNTSINIALTGSTSGGGGMVTTANARTVGYYILDTT